LLALGLQLGCLQKHEHLSRPDQVALTDEHLRDTAADLGSEAHFLDLARALQPHLGAPLSHHPPPARPTPKGTYHPTADQALADFHGRSPFVARSGACGTTTGAHRAKQLNSSNRTGPGPSEIPLPAMKRRGWIPRDGGSIGQVRLTLRCSWPWPEPTALRRPH